MSIRTALWMLGGLGLAFAPKSCAKRPTLPHTSDQPLQLKIATCALEMVAPSRFKAVTLSNPHEAFQIHDGEGVEVVGQCMPMTATLPLPLESRFSALWNGNYATEAEQEGTTGMPRWVQSNVQMAPVDGHPVVAARRFSLKGDRRSVLMITERARFVYWAAYSAPVAKWAELEPERSAVLRSLRVTRADADAGPVRYWHHDFNDTDLTYRSERTAHRERTRRGGTPNPAADPRLAPVARAGFDLVAVRGGAGSLATYITPDPAPRGQVPKRLPALVWAHWGHHGLIGIASDPASARAYDVDVDAFRRAGVVFAAGTTRGEGNNGGVREVLAGDVDDYLAIVEHVRRLPYVDPERVYFAGHRNGATLALLAAAYTQRHRAVFAFGGEMQFQPNSVPTLPHLTFDATDPGEQLLRSPGAFAGDWTRPVYLFDGRGSFSIGDAQLLAERARKRGKIFGVFPLLQADLLNYVQPLSAHIAAKIAEDSGPTCSIKFSPADVAALPVQPLPDEDEDEGEDDASSD